MVREGLGLVHGMGIRVIMCRERRSLAGTVEGRGWCCMEVRTSWATMPFAKDGGTTSPPSGSAVNVVDGDAEGKVSKVKVKGLQVFPTRCENFQVNRLRQEERDWQWVRRQVVELSEVGGPEWKEAQEGSFGFEL